MLQELLGKVKNAEQYRFISALLHLAWSEHAVLLHCSYLVFGDRSLANNMLPDVCKC